MFIADAVSHADRRPIRTDWDTHAVGSFFRNDDQIIGFEAYEGCELRLETLLGCLIFGNLANAASP